MTPIATPFGRHSTAAEVVEEIYLSGKRAIVTGAASGIGAAWDYLLHILVNYTGVMPLPKQHTPAED